MRVRVLQRRWWLLPAGRAFVRSSVVGRGACGREWEERESGRAGAPSRAATESRAGSEQAPRGKMSEFEEAKAFLQKDENGTNLVGGEVRAGCARAHARRSWRSAVWRGWRSGRAGTGRLTDV